MNRRMEAGEGKQLDLESDVLISDLVEEKGSILADIIYVRDISYGDDVSTSSGMVEIDGGGLNVQGTQTVSIC